MAAALPQRGSWRSRGAAALAGLTLRQLSLVLPPGRPWGLWTSRQIVARLMDTFGPSLTGTRVEQVDVRTPDGVVLMSPLVDLTFTLARSRESTRPDPTMRSQHALRLVDLYCTGTESAHPRLTLDVAGGRPLPPTLIQAGEAEMLAADAIALAGDLRAAGGRAHLQIWPDQVHVFQALPRLAPEAVPAMRVVAAFVTDVLADTAVEQAG